MKPPRLFAEIPAGLASVSLALQGGKHCKPPVSRMGNKAGYALPILDAMGLRPGQGAESYLWTEADPDVRALLCAYTQPALLRAVAEVLRGWKDEEPRALWTRLRDERRARKAALPLNQSVAEWMFLHHGSFSGKDIEGGMGRPQGASGAEWAGFAVGSGVRPSLDIVHDAAERLATGPGWPPVAVTAAAPSAEEVAAWVAVQHYQWAGKPVVVAPDGTWNALRGDGNGGPTGAGFRLRPPPDVGHLTALQWPPTCITSRAPTAEEVAGWLAFVAGSHPGDGGFRGPHRHRPNADGFCPSRANQADAIDRLAQPWPPTCITSRAPTAEEVARWLAYVTRTHQGGGGFRPPSTPASASEIADGHTVHTHYALDAPAPAIDRLAAVSWPPTLVTSEAPTAEEVAGWLQYIARSVSSRPTEPTPGADLEGCVIYMDPPYVGTTGYGADLPRAEVVRLATSYAAAGALVVVSEAVAIPELTALGWDAVGIAGERRGQRRTFSRAQGEWITMSRPPVNRPAVAQPLFALGAA